LADWHRLLAEKASPAAKPPLLRRRDDYLNEFLKKHPADDPARIRAAADLVEVRAELARLGEGRRLEFWSDDTPALGIPATPEVRKAVRRAQDGLLSLQQPDGAWPALHAPGQTYYHPYWPTALAVFALLDSRRSATEEPLAKALALLAAQDAQQIVKTRTLAFRLACWAACQDELRGRYDRLLRAEALALMRATADGSYGLEIEPGRQTKDGDAIHTQYALLGILQAERAGAKIPEAFWTKTLNWWIRTRNRDGGWGYETGGATAHWPTVAGAASMMICLNRIGRARDETLRHGAVAAAMTWISEHYDDGKNRNPLHYLYACSRLGVAAGKTRYGRPDRPEWFLWGATELIKRQDQQGLWDVKGQIKTTSTALGLLFLNAATAGR
jgi:hypothetical protein